MYGPWVLLGMVVYRVILITVTCSAQGSPRRRFPTPLVRPCRFLGLRSPPRLHLRSEKKKRKDFGKKEIQSSRTKEFFNFGQKIQMNQSPAGDEAALSTAQSQKVMYKRGTLTNVLVGPAESTCGQSEFLVNFKSNGNHMYNLMC